jgi:hypothetical protein
MTQYYYAPDAADENNLPAEWAGWASSSGEVTTVEAASKVLIDGSSDPYLRVSGSGGGNTWGLRFVPAGSITGDCEVYMEYRVQTTASDNAGLMLGLVNTANRNAYLASIQPSTSVQRVLRTVQGGASVQLDSDAFTTTASVKYKMLFKRTGTTHEMKTWLASADESTAVVSTGTDSTYAMEGHTGVGIWNATAGFNVYFWGLGTGSDSAPRSVPSSGPISFTGTVPTLNGTVGVPFSEDLSSYFSGTETPFAYSLQAGTLPDGLSLNSSTGVISGTPTTAGDATGIVIRGTDDGADTADSNSFTISIAARSFAADAGSFTLTGGNVDFITEAAGFDADAGTFTLTGGSITFAASSATVTVSDPLVNNTGTVLASQTGIVASVLNASTLESVFETTGLTTNGSGILDTITSGLITPTSSYYVVVKLADGSVGIAGPITAT